MSTSTRKEVLAAGRILAQGAARSCQLAVAKRSSCACIIFGLYCIHVAFKSCLRCCGILSQLPTEILRINLSTRFFALVTHKVFFIVSQICFGHRVNYLLSGVEWSVKVEFIIENVNYLERKKDL